MSKESDIQSISSNCKETVRSSVKRENTRGRRLRKITLNILVLLIIFCLGLILGKTIFTDTANNKIDDQIKHQYVDTASFQMDDSDDLMDDFDLFVFAYDTEQKLADLYDRVEKLFFDKAGLSPESHEVKELMATVREIGRPLLNVGPFSVFVNNDTSKFTVFEKLPFMPLVEIEWVSQKLSKRFYFNSSVERGWHLPRFQSHLVYSDDRVYMMGAFSVHGQNGMLERTYYDAR